ncbi:hypothetical protein QQZ08_005950 [Neonectria magnoliae]|uniref:HNH nuclease domain-containing protein n=1 Tax=Neonectria magnoliae TaxID=2732573 RepID=A0ABR1I1Y1_9HYPO
MPEPAHTDNDLNSPTGMPFAIPDRTRSLSRPRDSTPIVSITTASTSASASASVLDPASVLVPAAVLDSKFASSSASTSTAEAPSTSVSVVDSASVSIPVSETNSVSVAGAYQMPHPVPNRTSSKRKVLPWSQTFSNKSTEELRELQNNTDYQIASARKKAKRNISMDAEYWKSFSHLYQLHQNQVIVQSELACQAYMAQACCKDMTEDEWRNSDEAGRLEIQLRGWQQFESIANKHTERLEKRLSSGRESWLRIFSTSKVGLNLNGGVGRRDSSDQSNFAEKMEEAYCPSPPAEDHRWDPVLQCWGYRSIVKAAHLYPWRQVNGMDFIFGKGAQKEIFSPLNGLFLHEIIEDALNKGLVAIVPDVAMEPKNPEFPQEDQDERQQRIRNWESQHVKEYKLIVVNKASPVVMKSKFYGNSLGVSTILDLHDRKLVFKTNFRPRARYIWWTFLNTILHVSWNSDNNVQHAEIRKVTRYWGTRGRYVKQNMLLGYVEELGQDVDSILEYATDDEGEEQPDFGAVGVVVDEAVHRAASYGRGDEDDSSDDGDEEYNKVYELLST